MHTTTRLPRQLITTLVVLALLVLPTLGSAAPPRPGTYTGKTSQRTDVSLTVDAAARRVETFRIRYRAACHDGTTVNGRFTYRNLRVRRGRFSGTARTTGVLKGVPVVHNVRVVGRFASRDRAAGRWTVRLTVKRAHPVVCTAKRLRWSARR
jgi:hypothetical protein